MYNKGSEEDTGKHVNSKNYKFSDLECNTLLNWVANAVNRYQTFTISLASNKVSGYVLKSLQLADVIG